MEIQYVTALRGPNIWARFPVLEIWLDLGEWRDRASSDIPGFNARLAALLPGLYEHGCSVGEPGGFFQRLERGTYLAHILEHVLLELQGLAGTPVSFGKTRMTHQDGVYKMAVEFAVEDLARAAVVPARDLCLAAALDRPFDVQAALAPLQAIREREHAHPFSNTLLEAARIFGVPAWKLNAGGLLQFGQGANQRRLLEGQTDRSSAVGNSVAYDRELTRTFLQAVGTPLPWGRSANDAADAWAIAQEMTLPVVLRPRYVSGVGSVLGPFDRQDAVEAAFTQARSEGWWPLVDHHAGGSEHRFLVVGGRVVAGLTAEGQTLNPDAIHPELGARLVEAVAALKIELAEVEAVLADIRQPLEGQKGVVVGVASQPALKKYPMERVARAVLGHFYADPRTSRIPIVGVTGTNGKTTTTRLTHHLLSLPFDPVGMCCTEGIYIGTRRIAKGDCSGPKSARSVLQHYQPKAAVLETARGGILREGLGFDRCDVAIVTNIGAGDHLGSCDVETPEDLAWVKSTLVWAVADWGSAVLNAADPLVVAMAQYCHGKVIYFALNGEHGPIFEHRAQGGRAVFARDNGIVLAEGTVERVLLSLEKVPLTHGGLIGFHVENTLAAVAAAWALDIPDATIVRGLTTFDPGMDRLPARFNILDIGGVTVVLDYGHNTSAVAKLLEVLDHFPHAYRSVVYSAAGDRRNADIIDQGEQLGGAFDRVIIYEDTYLRGRARGEISDLFRQGMKRADRVTEILEITGGMEAIEKALEVCQPGELLVVQPDRIDDGVALLKRFVARGGREITLHQAIHSPFPRKKETTYA